MILLIDNYDSFVQNLARYLRRLGQQTQVVRNDQLTIPQIRQLAPQAIVISPGPCTPHEAGCSLEVVRQLGAETPILGVCLGHQTIAAALGGKVIRAQQPRHGQASPVYHQGTGLFAGLAGPTSVGRYHSLVVEEASLPKDLEVTARTADGVVMALQHQTWPLYGVQFHPESILTDQGYELLANFLRHAGLPVPTDIPQKSDELKPTFRPTWQSPTRPVTF